LIKNFVNHVFPFCFQVSCIQKITSLKLFVSISFSVWIDLDSLQLSQL